MSQASTKSATEILEGLPSPHLVGMGDWYIGEGPKPVKSVPLGGCISMIACKPPFAGMVNMVLPHSKIDPEKSKIIPGFFVDSAIGKICDALGHQNIAIAECQIYLIGGASLANPMLRIGDKIYRAILAETQRRKIDVTKQEIGGNESKMAWVIPQTGQIIVEIAGGKQRIL